MPLLRSRAVLTLAALAALAWVLTWLLGADPAPGSLPLREMSAAPESPASPVGGPDVDPPTETPSPSAPESATRPAPSDSDFVGIVQNERGATLFNVDVDLWQADVRSARGAPYADLAHLAHTKSDRDGSFRLPALGQGPWRLVARAATYAPAQRLLSARGVFTHLVLSEGTVLRLHVFGVDGAPLEQAQVWIGEDGRWRDGELDAGGAFRLEGLAPGSVRVRVRAPGYAPVAAGPFLLELKEVTEAGVKLERWVRVAGRVVNASGEALAGARVFLTRPGEGPEPVLSDDSGRFAEMDAGAPGERVFLSAELPGHRPSLEPIILPDLLGVLDVEVELESAPAVTGTVVNAAGQPVEGADVAYTFDGISRREPAHAWSDAQGRFELPPAPRPAPGRRVLVYARQGSALAAVDPATLAAGAQVVLMLASGLAVSGRLLGPDEAPLARAPVQIVADPSGRGADPEGQVELRRSLLNELGFAGMASGTDALGNFRIVGVPAGRWRLRTLMADGWISAGPVFDLRGDEDLGSLRVGLGATLEGRVRGPGGRALAGAQVLLSDPGDAGALRRVRSGATGEFRFDGLAPGSYQLRALHSPLVPAQQEVDFQRDLVLDVDLEAAATLALEAYDGAQPYNGWLEVGLARPGTGRPVSRMLRARGGLTEWLAAPTGTWRLHVRTPDGRVAQTEPEIELESGRRTQRSVALQASATLRGVVRDSRANGCAGAEVTLQAPHGGSRQTTANARGEFSFVGLVQGVYQIHAHGNGGAPVYQSVDVSAGDELSLRLDLAPAGRLLVRIQDDQGRPMRGALLLFADARAVIPPVRPLRTDERGEAQRGDLPAGRVRVRARLPDGRQASGDAQVVAGQTVQLELTLRP